MSGHENVYSVSQPLPQSFSHAGPSLAAAGTPPPPPPKPIPQHLQSQPLQQDPGRSGSPNFNTNSQTGPPLPPIPHYTDSPRPQPHLPSSSANQTSFQQPTSRQAQDEQQQQQTPHFFPPSISEHWLPSAPDLTALSTLDLHSLLSPSDQQSTTLITALAQTHHSHASSLAPLNSQLQSNIHLAQQVSDLADTVARLRSTTSQLLLQHASLQTTWRRKQSEMDDALSPWGPRAMYQRLVSSINEQEALLRAVQDSFLEGGGEDEYYGETRGSGKASEKEVSEWVRRIREGATVLEKRREMRARWDEGRVGGWR